MLLCTLVMLSMQPDVMYRLMSSLLAILIGFSLWYFRIWGGSDGKWLALIAAWLPLNEWPDLSLITGTLLLLVLIFFALRSFFRPADNQQQSIPFLLPLNSAAMILIIFHYPKFLSGF